MLSFRAPEFPTAVMVPRRPVARARWELWRWTVAKWAWIKPRTVPLIVAAMGMVFILASADYLSHVHGAPLHHVPAFNAK